MHFKSIIVALGLIATAAATPVPDAYGGGFPGLPGFPNPIPVPIVPPVIAPVTGSGNGNANLGGGGNGDGNGIISGPGGQTNVCGNGLQTMCCSHTAFGGFGINCLFLSFLGSGNCNQEVTCCNSQNQQTGLVNINFGCSKSLFPFPIIKE